MGEKKNKYSVKNTVDETKTKRKITNLTGFKKFEGTNTAFRWTQQEELEVRCRIRHLF